MRLLQLIPTPPANLTRHSSRDIYKKTDAAVFSPPIL
jgi:hypothetical protein